MLFEFTLIFCLFQLLSLKPTQSVKLPILLYALYILVLYISLYTDTVIVTVKQLGALRALGVVVSSQADNMHDSLAKPKISYSRSLLSILSP